MNEQEKIDELTDSSNIASESEEINYDEIPKWLKPIKPETTDVLVDFFKELICDIFHFRRWGRLIIKATFILPLIFSRGFL